MSVVNNWRRPCSCPADVKGWRGTADLTGVLSRCPAGLTPGSAGSLAESSQASQVASRVRGRRKAAFWEHELGLVTDVPETDQVP